MAMTEVDTSCATQLIYGDGTLNSYGVEDFMKHVKLAEFGYEYAVVSIMGPQSSGKSTLLNHLFGTKFQQMNAQTGRNQTTKGIWMARCVGIEPCTIVMDLEGCDGRERGENDTVFEKQIALFAVAVSDIVLINLWGNEIGRENPAFKPLLRTVFEVLMTRLDKPRKTTLLFSVRDSPRETPPKHLETTLKEDIEKIWNSAPKSETNQGRRLEEYFNVEPVFLPHYKYERKDFDKQVFAFRTRFFNSTAEGGLAGDRNNVDHASNFSVSVQRIWQQIQADEDLDIPNLQVLVANTRCDEIIREVCNDFKKDEGWRKLQNHDGEISNFGRKINSLIQKFCLNYDQKAKYLNAVVQGQKRGKLIQELSQIAQPTVRLMLTQAKLEPLKTFSDECGKALESKDLSVVANLRKSSELLMEEFEMECKDKLANWDTVTERQEFKRDLDKKLSSTITDYCKNEAKEALLDPLNEFLGEPDEKMWQKIRELLLFTESAEKKLSRMVHFFDFDEETMEKMHSGVKDYEKKVAEDAAVDATRHIKVFMNERFLRTFSDGLAKDFTVQEAGINAFTATVEVLSYMATTRFDNYADDIRETLFRALVDPIKDHLAGPADKPHVISLEVLDSNTWNKVSPNTKTLISPVQCKSQWQDFLRQIIPMVMAHIKKQEKQESWNYEEESSNYEEKNSSTFKKFWKKALAVFDFGEKASAVFDFGEKYSAVIEFCRLVAALFGLST